MQIEKHKEACHILSKIDKNPLQYLIIHYSCESFLNLPNGTSARITSIAIRYFENGQTDSFSIHKTAERKGIPLEDIKQYYDELELDMLKEYMTYLAHHQNFFFIHWNMRDGNYGFKAIEHRYLVLKNKKNDSDMLQIIPDTNKIDLSILLIKKYGSQYIEDPRIPKLVEKNQLNPRDFLTGTQEATAFEQQEYIKLHLSTLSKTRVLDSFLSMAIENTLKTNSKFVQIYGYSPQALWTVSNEKWYFALLFAIVSFILGKYSDIIVSSFIRLVP
ncbi:hypothetical protein [Propionispira raffinosivorans]|uniref:hypothetical protein n=1 Tax=Propionispira raffinosivorans TaxID=86959 RepID=UPI0003815F64|nr:hypothetical protein [Propionispira raffinosivorans]